VASLHLCGPHFRGAIALVSSLCCWGHLYADTIPEIVARAKPAVVQIITFDESKEPLKTGTGFFVTGDG
jgi:hypothetical protein